MNLLRLLLVSSLLASLPACSPELSDPGVVPPSTPADPPPPAKVTAQWKESEKHTVGELAMASSASGSAVAYAEWDDRDDNGLVRSAIKLRLISTDGSVGQDFSLFLGNVESSEPPRLTLASDGIRYLACWENKSQIACALVNPTKGSVSEAQSVTGDFPSLAFGGGAWVLAHRIPGHVALTRIGSDGLATGELALVDATQESEPTNLLAATKSGFLLVTGGEAVVAQPLDSAFAPTSAPIDLGVRSWFHGAITAAGERVVVSLAKPYGGSLFFFDGGALTGSHALEGGGKTGLNVALAADGSSFALISADDYDGINASSIVADQVIEQEKKLLSGRGIFDEGSLAVVSMKGDLFFAATARHEIFVARMTRP